MSMKFTKVGKVEGRGLGHAETFLSTSCVDGIELTSPAPSSSASQVSGPVSVHGVVLSPPPVVDVTALFQAGASPALVELMLKSYERMYAMYCAASSGQSVVSAVSRSRPRRRKSSAVASVASVTSRVSSVGTQDFDFEGVAKLVEGYGTGFCYLWFFSEEAHESLAASLGSCPTLGQLAKVPQSLWRAPEELQSLGVCQTRQGTFHVYPYPQSGAVRALTFLRSAQGFVIPWVTAMGMISCTMPGVFETARVGVGDVVERSVALPAPVAVFEADPVFRGCVVGALPTGKVVQFSGGRQQLVGMETRGVQWWALNEGARWSATKTVNFLTPRRLPALQGNPDVTWEGFSYLNLISIPSRPWVIGKLGRSPSLSEIASLPVSVFDLVGLHKSSFTCSERGLVLWSADEGTVPDFRFEDLVTFACRQAVPVLGTFGAFLVSRETSDAEVAAAREYSRWVVRKTIGVGAMEVRMPFEIDAVRLV